MLLKYIQEGLSLGFKVHDTVLRFQISRLSMHVPDGVLTDMMGIEDCCFGVGVGVLLYLCVCVFAGRLGWGVTFVFAPLGDSESCMPGPKASAQGADMMWGWPHRGRRGVMLGGEGFWFFFQIFEKRQTHIFF